MKFKYKDKVRTISDIEHDGFFVGIEGVLKDVSKTQAKDGILRYEISFLDEVGDHRRLFAREDEIEKIQ